MVIIQCGPDHKPNSRWGGRYTMLKDLYKITLEIRGLCLQLISLYILRGICFPLFSRNNSLNPPFYPSALLPTYPFTYPLSTDSSIHLTIYPLIHPPNHLRIYLFSFIHTPPFIYPSTHWSIHPSIHSSIHSTFESLLCACHSLYKVLKPPTKFYS